MAKSSAAGTLAQQRRQLLGLDAVGHAPARTKHDGLHIGGESRRWPRGLTDDDLVGMDHPVALDDAREELRHVVPNVELTEIRRHPAPALHIDKDAIDRCIAALTLKRRLTTDIRARAFDIDGWIPTVGTLQLRHRAPQLCPVGDLPFLGVRPLLAPASLCLGATQLQEQLAQPLELLVLWVQCAQVGIGRIGGGKAGENQRGWMNGRRVVQRLRRARWITDAATARVACVLEDREREFDLGLGGGLGRRFCRGRLREGEIAAAQSPVVGSADLCNDSPRLIRKPALGYPDQRARPLAIEHGHCRQVVGIGPPPERGQHLAQRDESWTWRRRFLGRRDR